MNTNIIYRFDYFPYGKVVREYVGADKERYLTTQHERDAETGLDYRGARYYDSDVARFLSLDPLARDYPSLSDYSYVAGNPLIFTDPTGKAVEYSKETAKAMAARGKSNGYTTSVVANPDKAGDYGVSFTKTVNGQTYHKTQFEGKFTGIGKEGLVSNPNSKRGEPGLATVGITGSLIAGVGVSGEIGLIFKPSDIKINTSGALKWAPSAWYSTLESGYGVNGGFGITGSIYLPQNSQEGILPKDLSGTGHNNSIVAGPFNGSWGGDQLNHNDSRANYKYNSFSLGLGLGWPIGYSQTTGSTTVTNF